MGRLPGWSALVSGSHSYSLTVLALRGFGPILPRAGICPSLLHSPTSAPDLTVTQAPAPHVHRTLLEFAFLKLQAQVRVEFELLTLEEETATYSAILA